MLLVPAPRRPIYMTTQSLSRPPFPCGGGLAPADTGTGVPTGVPPMRPLTDDPGLPRPTPTPEETLARGPGEEEEPPKLLEGWLG